MGTRLSCEAPCAFPPARGKVGMGGQAPVAGGQTLHPHPGPPPSQLILADIRQPIGRLQLNLAMPDLEDVILQVINTVLPYGGEVQDREGRWYSLQIRTYERT
jgi:hypothetical protein